jgi:hypothetical protein
MTDPTAPRIITAPFTGRQVAMLNAYQICGLFHPFTCDGKRWFGRRCRRVLIATPDGWRCTRWSCTYRQGWAHAWMATFAGVPKENGESHDD